MLIAYAHCSQVAEKKMSHGRLQVVFGLHLFMARVDRRSDYSINNSQDIQHMGVVFKMPA